MNRNRMDENQILRDRCKVILNKEDTQECKVLRHLLEKGETSVRELAQEPFYINCPNAVIRDLRNYGIPITDDWVSRENSQGKKTRFKVFTLFIPDPFNELKDYMYIGYC